MMGKSRPNAGLASGYRLSPNEVDALLQEEKRKKRIKRILQVREQSKANAAEIRHAVKKEEEKQRKILGTKILQQWEEEKQNKLERLEEEYDACLRTIGQGHAEAQGVEKENRDWVKQQQTEKDSEAARQRHQEAMMKEREERRARHAEQTRQIRARKAAILKEKERASKVAALPTPEPDTWDTVQLPKHKPVVLVDAEAFSSTYFHLVDEDYAVQKATSFEQVDAKSAAVDAEHRATEVQGNIDRLRNERAEKARLRGKHALYKEHLKTEYDKLLHDLSDLQRDDIIRRQHHVADIPRTIFLPPHRRLVEKEETQKDMETAFEDVFMKATDQAGDMSLALDPHPMPESPAPTDDLNLTQEDVTQMAPSSPKGFEAKREAAMKDITESLADKGKGKNKSLKKLLSQIKDQRDAWISKTTQEIPEQDGMKLPISVQRSPPKVPTPVAQSPSQYSVSSEEQSIASPMDDSRRPPLAQGIRHVQFGDEAKVRVHIPPATKPDVPKPVHPDSGVLRHPLEEAARIRQAAQKQMRTVDKQLINFEEVRAIEDLEHLSTSKHDISASSLQARKQRKQLEEQSREIERKIVELETRRKLIEDQDSKIGRGVPRALQREAPAAPSIQGVVPTVTSRELAPTSRDSSIHRAYDWMEPAPSQTRTVPQEKDHLQKVRDFQRQLIERHKSGRTTSFTSGSSADTSAISSRLEQPSLPYEQISAPGYEPAPVSRYGPVPGAPRYEEAPPSGYETVPTSRYKPTPVSQYEQAPAVPRYESAPASRYELEPVAQYEPVPVAARYESVPISRYEPAPVDRAVPFRQQDARATDYIAPDLPTYIRPTQAIQEPGISRPTPGPTQFPPSRAYVEPRKSPAVQPGQEPSPGADLTTATRRLFDDQAPRRKSPTFTDTSLSPRQYVRSPERTSPTSPKRAFETSPKRATETSPKRSRETERVTSPQRVTDISPKRFGLETGPTRAYTDTSSYSETSPSSLGPRTEFGRPVQTSLHSPGSLMELVPHPEEREQAARRPAVESKKFTVESEHPDSADSDDQIKISEIYKRQVEIEKRKEELQRELAEVQRQKKELLGRHLEQQASPGLDWSQKLQEWMKPLSVETPGRTSEATPDRTRLSMSSEDQTVEIDERLIEEIDQLYSEDSSPESEAGRFKVRPPPLSRRVVYREDVVPHELSTIQEVETPKSDRTAPSMHSPGKSFAFDPSPRIPSASSTPTGTPSGSPQKLITFTNADLSDTTISELIRSQWDSRVETPVGSPSSVRKQYAEHGYEPSPGGIVHTTPSQARPETRSRLSDTSRQTPSPTLHIPSKKTPVFVEKVEGDDILKRLTVQKRAPVSTRMSTPPATWEAVLHDESSGLSTGLISSEDTRTSSGEDRFSSLTSHTITSTDQSVQDRRSLSLKERLAAGISGPSETSSQSDSYMTGTSPGTLIARRSAEASQYFVSSSETDTSSSVLKKDSSLEMFELKSSTTSTSTFEEKTSDGAPQTRPGDLTQYTIVSQDDTRFSQSMRSPKHYHELTQYTIGSMDETRPSPSEEASPTQSPGTSIGPAREGTESYFESSRKKFVDAKNLAKEAEFVTPALKQRRELGTSTESRYSEQDSGASSRGFDGSLAQGAPELTQRTVSPQSLHPGSVVSNRKQVSFLSQHSLTQQSIQPGDVSSDQSRSVHLSNLHEDQRDQTLRDLSQTPFAEMSDRSRLPDLTQMTLPEESFAQDRILKELKESFQEQGRLNLTQRSTLSERKSSTPAQVLTQKLHSFIDQGRLSEIPRAPALLQRQPDLTQHTISSENGSFMTDTSYGPQRQKDFTQPRLISGTESSQESTLPHQKPPRFTRSMASENTPAAASFPSQRQQNLTQHSIISETGSSSLAEMSQNLRSLMEQSLTSEASIYPPVDSSRRHPKPKDLTQQSIISDSGSSTLTDMTSRHQTLHGLTQHSVTSEASMPSRADASFDPQKPKDLTQHSVISDTSSSAYAEISFPLKKPKDLTQQSFISDTGSSTPAEMSLPHRELHGLTQHSLTSEPSMSTPADTSFPPKKIKDLTEHSIISETGSSTPGEMSLPHQQLRSLMQHSLTSEPSMSTPADASLRPPKPKDLTQQSIVSDTSSSTPAETSFPPQKLHGLTQHSLTSEPSMSTPADVSFQPRKSKDLTQHSIISDTGSSTPAETSFPPQKLHGLAQHSLTSDVSFPAQKRKDLTQHSIISDTGSSTPAETSFPHQKLHGLTQHSLTSEPGMTTLADTSFPPKRTKDLTQHSIISDTGSSTPAETSFPHQKLHGLTQHSLISEPGMSTPADTSFPPKRTKDLTQHSIISDTGSSTPAETSFPHQKLHGLTQHSLTSEPGMSTPADTSFPPKRTKDLTQHSIISDTGSSTPAETSLPHRQLQSLTKHSLTSEHSTSTPADMSFPKRPTNLTQHSIISETGSSTPAETSLPHQKQSFTKDSLISETGIYTPGYVSFQKGQNLTQHSLISTSSSSTPDSLQDKPHSLTQHVISDTSSSSPDQAVQREHGLTQHVISDTSTSSSSPDQAVQRAQGLTQHSLLSQSSGSTSSLTPALKNLTQHSITSDSSTPDQGKVPDLTQHSITPDSSQPSPLNKTDGTSDMQELSQYTLTSDGTDQEKRSPRPDLTQYSVDSESSSSSTAQSVVAKAKPDLTQMSITDSSSPEMSQKVDLTQYSFSTDDQSRLRDSKKYGKVSPKDLSQYAIREKSMYPVSSPNTSDFDTLTPHETMLGAEVQHIATERVAVPSKAPTQAGMSVSQHPIPQSDLSTSQHLIPPTDLSTSQHLIPPTDASVTQLDLQTDLSTSQHPIPPTDMSVSQLALQTDLSTSQHILPPTDISVGSQIPLQTDQETSQHLIPPTDLSASQIPLQTDFETSQHPIPPTDLSASQLPLQTDLETSQHPIPQTDASVSQLRIPDLSVTQHSLRSDLSTSQHPLGQTALSVSQYPVSDHGTPATSLWLTDASRQTDGHLTTSSSSRQVDRLIESGLSELTQRDLSTFDMQRQDSSDESSDAHRHLTTSSSSRQVDRLIESGLSELTERDLSTFDMQRQDSSDSAHRHLTTSSSSRQVDRLIESGLSELTQRDLSTFDMHRQDSSDSAHRHLTTSSSSRQVDRLIESGLSELTQRDLSTFDNDMQRQDSSDESSDAHTDRIVADTRRLREQYLGATSDESTHLMYSSEEKGIMDEPELTFSSLVSETSDTMTSGGDDDDDDTNLTITMEESDSLLSFQAHEFEEGEDSLVSLTPETTAMTDTLELPETSTSTAGSLQEAFAKKRGKFIKKSQDRVEQIKTKPQDEPSATGGLGKTLAAWKKSRALNTATATSSGARPKVTMTMKTTDDRKKEEKDMKKRTERLYSRLEEVKEQRTHKQRQKEYASNREKAKEYQKKILDQVRKKNNTNGKK